MSPKMLKYSSVSDPANQSGNKRDKTDKKCLIGLIWAENTAWLAGSATEEYFNIFGDMF